MKKGTKFKLAALLLGAALILPACTFGKTNTNTSEEQQTSDSQGTTETTETGTSEEVKYTVAISNKEALQAEWPVNAGNRKVEIDVTPRANIAALLAEGKLTITTSNAQVLTIAGQMATPVAPGTAKITITAGDSTDSVDVTIAKEVTNKDIYGTVHEGTADDPFDNEDAIKAAKKNIEDKLGGKFYIRGEIASFYHAPGSRQDGMVSWFLKPATEGGEKFEVYKCLGADGKTPLTDDDIWVGGTATAYGDFAVYNGQYETSSATFVSCEGNKPQPRKTVEATFADALAAAKALADGADTYDYYQFPAYATKKDGSDYYLTATKGEAITDAKENAIQLYNVADTDAVAKLTKDASLKVTMVLKNYHGQVENLFKVEADQIEVVEAGGDWVAPEAEKINVTQALTKINAIDISGVTEDNTTLYVEDGKLFEVTGIVTKKGSYNDSYGNGDVYIADVAGDQDNTLQVFRIKDKDLFNSLTVDKTTVAVTCKLAAYVKLVDGVPTLKARETNANPDVVVVDQGEGGGGGEQEVNPLTEALTLDFSGLNVTTATAFTADTLLAALKASAPEGKADLVLSVASLSKVYNGNGSGGAHQNEAGLIKTGTGSAAGEMTVKFGALFNKVVINCHDFYAKSDDHPTNSNTVAVNGSDPVLAPYNTTGEWADLTFGSLTDTDTLKLDFANRVTIKSITLSYEGGEAPVEHAQPMGAYYGYATGQGDSQVFVDIAVANTLAFVEIGSYKATAEFAFDKYSGVFSITTNVEELGTVSGIYDDNTNTFGQLSVSGTGSALLKNNGEIELAAVTHFWDCEGTEVELNATFARRVRPAGKGWNTALEDVALDSTNVAAGEAAVSRAGSTTDDAIGLTLRNDFNEVQTVSNIGFWVYNPTDKDITLRTWYFTAKSYATWAEIGELTAKANGWSYCRMGFGGSKAIYNVNICDWTKGGATLTFDNIALF